MQVERLAFLQKRANSGKRVSNTLVTYLEVVNNLPKGELIHDKNGGTYVIPI